MSRGPGRMMRAALAELAAHESVSAWSVAVRAAHDAACGCADNPHCLDRFGDISRAQLVSARRALHTLASQGKAELHRQPNGWDAKPPWLIAKRCQPPMPSGVGNVYVQMWRETDRCDSCARAFSETGIGSVTINGAPPGVARVQGLALCHDCEKGLTDPIHLASSGEYVFSRMAPIPCADCGGTLSEAGLHRLYVDGATYPLCDTCYAAHSSRRLAEWRAKA